MKNHKIDNWLETNYQHVLLFFIYFCAIALRVYIAISRSDSHWPDEQFQTLEPASLIIFHHGYLSWEWIDGYRSWVVPGLYMPLFFILKKIGIAGGDTVIHLSRLFTALACSVVIFRIDKIFRILGISFWSRIIALAFFAFSPGMILYACSTLADNWAMIILWIILPEILLRIDSKDKMDWFLIGIFAGLTILVKYQMLFWLAGLGLTVLMIRVPFLLCIAGAAGCALILFLNGVLDWVTWGQFFHSLIQHITRGYEISTHYDISPWWNYFPKITDDLGLLLLLSLLYCLVLSLFRWRSSITFLSSLTKKLAVIYVPCFVFIVIHMLLGHKENRFLLPIYPCFFILLGILLDTTFIPAFLAKLSKLQGAWFLIMALPLFSLNFLGMTELILTPLNIADLETAIYNSHDLSPKGDSCILLFNHSWAWTHGELILGQKVSYVDSSIKKVLHSQLQECRYAIVPKPVGSDFENKAGQTWKIVKTTNKYYGLYRNMMVIR